MQIGGYWAGIELFNRWGKSRGLEISRGWHGWEIFGFAVMATITLHELGHALVGRALGMRLRSFHAGPFLWFLEDERWRFHFVASGLFNLNGSAGVIPNGARYELWREICMVAAGLVTNLVTGFIACALVLRAPDSGYENQWQFLAEFGTLSLVIFASNLIPVRPPAGYSDGARIYQAVRGGPLTDLHRVLLRAAATQVSHVRPRDYDFQAICRAKPVFEKGYEAVILRLIESEYFLDQGRFEEAASAFLDAETICEASVPTFPIEQHTLFVFGNAFLRRDACAARKWWDRMSARRLHRFDSNYWAALSSLNWIEGRPAEALEAWANGAKVQERLRFAGFGRYRDSLLRKEIEESMRARVVDQPNWTQPSTEPRREVPNPAHNLTA